jgi:glycosyltransferase involved in cell wall biosynthesis
MATTECVSPTRKPSVTRKVVLSVALLTGCQDRSYAFALAMELSSKGLRIDVIGNNRVDSPEFHTTPNVTFFNLGGIQELRSTFPTKLIQLLLYYLRLIRYLAFPKPKIVHVLWNSKFEYFDRTILMLYCKFLRKKIVLTAHNVNRAKRDSRDSLLNRLTLKTQYRLADHIFVHTESMKSEICADFGVRPEAVTRIPFGMNVAVPHTSLSTTAAKSKLGIREQEKTILFFGRIAPYKGLEYLLVAFERLLKTDPDYRLVIAGEPMPGHEEYLEKVRSIMNQPEMENQLVQKLEFVPDEDTELYFKAADVVALPYKDIFQSGVLFLGFSFGLPAITADVGSFREDVAPGQRGFLFEPGNSTSLANAIEQYFASDLYKNLETRRIEIREFASKQHSWETAGEITRKVYQELTVGPAD